MTSYCLDMLIVEKGTRRDVGRVRKELGIEKTASSPKKSYKGQVLGLVVDVGFEDNGHYISDEMTSFLICSFVIWLLLNVCFFCTIDCCFFFFCSVFH